MSLVQVAGYYVFEEPHHDEARKFFAEGLATGCERAAELGVTLGLENMDGLDVLSVSDALGILAELHHPSLGLHIDVGNLAANGFDVTEQIELAAPHLVAVDLKDTRPGEYRRVPFGDGIVPFSDAFAVLDSHGFTGPYAVEMWNELPHGENIHAAAEARKWLQSIRRM